jgi:hypothetical protein
LAGETKVLGESLPQCHFVHHKPNLLCPDANLDHRSGKPAPNRLSYGTAWLPTLAHTQRIAGGVFHHFAPGKCWDSSLIKATTDSFWFIICSYPIIQYCKTYETEELSLNKPRVNVYLKFKFL